MKKILISIIALSMLSVSFAAWAGEKEEVEEAFSKWRSALTTGNAKNVVELYDTDAVLLATLSANPITTQEGRIKYFTKLVAKPKLSASVQEEHIRLLDKNNVALSGLYTFKFEEDEKTVEIPARYSFVYEKINNNWKIVEHHSSRIPTEK